MTPSAQNMIFGASGDLIRRKLVPARRRRIELRRRSPNVTCPALHPGTVDTDLSRPFQQNVPAARLFDAKRAAEQLLGVVDSCTRDDGGRFLAWDGQPIPW